ncbi:NAD(+)--dinitrogen-reductase ADP-D-ribosyltransferase [Roseateles sp.]|uniref:NAD(+)--dinitrogen-reductase ADP-D-ribosyltransferase n=1 Tax=Roseateles sp. TaxID=1971397 RepID=UPI002E06ECCE|nr:NAD(+)--dinitrogen-reductase ADP-D-ribosyltransferase [Roseateles sp.]
MGDEHDPAGWYTTNLVGIPAPVLASAGFNAHPQPLHVAGVRESHAGLFALLQRCTDAAEARGVFAHYMSLAFGLQRRAAGSDDAAEPRRWRASYLKLLQGWGLDANGAAGAVLKGWVESRFGIVPVFHRAVLARFPSPAWTTYLEEKAGSRFHNNNIFQQLDLLYEFSQWMLARFQPLGAEPRVTLWRGSTRCEEQVLAGSLRGRQCTVRLNNLVSFSLAREQAGCFGDWLLQAEVPQVKLLLWPGLLASATLQGESEVLAVGGCYEVLARYD